MTSDRRRQAWRRGRLAEWLCVLSLRLRGYRVLARGYRTRVGEIDIVARRGGVLAVIEVKARAGEEAAGEAVTQRQRSRIMRATEQFLLAHRGLGHLSVRFDAMLVGRLAPPRHVRDAWRLR